ncbi:hypothetical protein DERP_009669 [Dermatophagoides pteronyssinus]|uniref:Uncharacterized protein n=1 Tax=Dermatophagoides pteronyssinus TaxID=6956 RepID=A0ABQ8JAH8_DERPT|nr:hypothetical protein DERP_009669 [Dermatophagoides pteronyssinus]
MPHSRKLLHSYTHLRAQHSDTFILNNTIFLRTVTSTSKEPLYNLHEYLMGIQFDTITLE